jgi:predicted membrane-bound spermidine synthase
VSRPLAVALLVALSGFCSLIYQVVWERTLRYSFGGDSISAAIVTGTFLLGLGLGAVVFGRWYRQPFARYAAVEAAIGVYGLASFFALAPLARVLGAWFEPGIAAAEGLRPAVVVAAILFLLPPCILIGGTGPLMFNCFIRSAAYRASAVGWIYGMNTFGAALGVLAAPFVFLNRVSLPVTLAIVGLLNFGLAGALLVWGRRVGEAAPAEPIGSAPSPGGPGATAPTGSRGEAPVGPRGVAPAGSSGGAPASPRSAAPAGSHGAVAADPRGVAPTGLRGGSSGAAPGSAPGSVGREAMAPAAPGPAGGTGAWGWLLPLAFLSGFIALAFEVSLVRALFVINPSSPYNFPAALIPFLLALAAGSAGFTRFRVWEPRRALRRIGRLFVAAVVGMLAAVVASASLSLAGVRAVGLASPAGEAALVLHATLLGAPLPAFLGAVLPLLLRLAAPTGPTLPARTGPLFLVNAAGSFSGAMLTQFVGFPQVGTRGVLLGLLWLGLAAGGVCLWRAGLGSPARRAAALAGLALVAGGPVLLPPVLWQVYATGVAGASADRIEGVTGVAAIAWDPAGGDLIVNGQYMSRLPDHPRHVRLVSFALALPRRDDALLLGLGGGGMVRELAQDPGIRRLDVVDWSYELPRLLDTARARDLLDDALRRAKVTVRRCDARVAVSLYAPASFDVVIDNLTIGHWVGATSVKSVEYFRQVRRIVKPGGVFVYHGNWGGARRAILAGLVATFPHVQLHPGADATEEVVLASSQPLDLDAGHAARVLEGLATRTGIRLAGGLVEGLHPVTADDVPRARPVRDDLLIYEYSRDPVRDLKRFVRSLVRRAWEAL